MDVDNPLIYEFHFRDERGQNKLFVTKRGHWKYCVGQIEGKIYFSRRSDPIIFPLCALCVFSSIFPESKKQFVEGSLFLQVRLHEESCAQNE